jgi:hypothetical protein
MCIVLAVAAADWLQRRLDDYDTIRVINFIRREVAAGRDPLPALVASGQQQQEGAAKPWAGDELLNPTLPDDPLITYDYEEQQQLEQEMGQLGINRWAPVQHYSSKSAKLWCVCIASCPTCCGRGSSRQQLQCQRTGISTPGRMAASGCKPGPNHVNFHSMMCTAWRCL